MTRLSTLITTLPVTVAITSAQLHPLSGMSLPGILVTTSSKHHYATGKFAAVIEKVFRKEMGKGLQTPSDEASDERTQSRVGKKKDS